MFNSEKYKWNSHDSSESISRNSEWFPYQVVSLDSMSNKENNLNFGAKAIFEIINIKKNREQCRSS